MTKHYRQKAADLGIWDDKLEAEFIRIMQDKDTDLELERVKVSAREDVLQDQLMEARVR